MRKLVALVAISALACMAMASKPKTPPAPPLSPLEANRKLVRDMVQTLFVEHKVDEAVTKYFDPNYIQHSPLAANGAQPLAAFFKQYYQTAPGSTVKVANVLCEGDLCAVHYNAIPKPGDRGIAMVDIFRIANGKLAEHWSVSQPVPETSANNNTMF